MPNSNEDNRLMRPVYILMFISAAVFGVAVGAIAGDAVSPAVEHKVDIRNFLYDPDPVIVNRGDTVTWTNHDIVPHTATFSGSDVGTGDIPVATSRSMIMEEPGDVSYVCRYHPNMKGVIRVQE